MPKMTIKGMDELISRLERMTTRPEGIVKRALYAGAGVMADALQGALASIPTDEGYGTDQKPLAGITPEEKAELVGSMGISRMDTRDAQVTVSIGFKGRNADGKRNSTIMKRVESGTSYMKKTPTIRPTINRTQAAVTAAMQAQFEKDLKENFERS